MFSHYCPRCCERIYDGQTTGESGIYKSHGVSLLCEACFFDEEREVDEKGRNDLPDTLARYRENDRRLNHV